MTSFASELDQLIRKYTDKARYCDDFIPILSALCNTADKLAEQADSYPFKGESEQDFREWLRYVAERQRKVAAGAVYRL